MNPLALLGWILIGGILAIVAAFIVAIVILIIRLALTVEVGSSSRKDVNRD